MLNLTYFEFSKTSILFCSPLPCSSFCELFSSLSLNSVVSFCLAQVVIYCLFTKCITKEFCKGCLAWDCNSEMLYIYKEEKHPFGYLCYFFRYADSVILLLPQLEAGLRLLFTTTNKCPNRLLTAEVNFCLKSIMI